MLLFILGLIMFVGLVVVHEFGHFIMAKRNGVEIEEFGIGFPPRLFKKKTKGGWLFTINLLPLGGFVKLKGEHDTDTAPGTFGAASLPAKSKIMAAGVVMNLITAFVLLTGLAWAGTPILICNQFTLKQDTHVVQDTRHLYAGLVEPDSPASKIGLQKGDELLAVGSSANNLHRILPECQFSDITKQHAGQPLVLKFKHQGKVIVRTAQLVSTAEVQKSQDTKHPKAYLGVGVDGSGLAYNRSTWSAPIVAGGLIKQFTVLTFQGLGKAVAGLGSLIAGGVTGNKTARQHGQTSASSQVSGPVGIFVILKDGSALGYRFILLIIAIISLTLAIMNILPIPALDGGRLWLMLITRAIKKPLSQDKEELINAGGFIFLLLLIVLITIVDIRRFF